MDKSPNLMLYKNGGSNKVIVRIKIVVKYLEQCFGS